MNSHSRALRPVIVVCVLGAMGLVGCDRSVDAKDIPDDAETGRMSVDIGGDATRDGGNDGTVAEAVDGVWLRLDEVSIHHEEEGWVFIDDGRVDINLMANRDGDTEEIGGGDVYVGGYDTLRLSITDSWIVVDGVELDLDVSSGSDDGLDLVVPISVDDSTTTTVWVGWDLDSQLELSGDAWSLGTDPDLTVDVDSN